MRHMKGYVSIFMNVKFHVNYELGGTWVTSKARGNTK